MRFVRIFWIKEGRLKYFRSEVPTRQVITRFELGFSNMKSQKRTKNKFTLNFMQKITFSHFEISKLRFHIQNHQFDFRILFLL